MAVRDALDGTESIELATPGGSAQIPLGQLGLAMPAILRWARGREPLPPQAFDRRAGDPSFTEQQRVLERLCDVLVAERRQGLLPAGAYRFSGAQPMKEYTGVAFALAGAGTRRSVIWMDPTYVGAAFTFRDIWWGSDLNAPPAGYVPASGFVANSPFLQTGQSWMGGLNLHHFSIVGTLTNGNTLVAASMNQRGIEFINRMDHARLSYLDFGNIAGGAFRSYQNGAVQAGGLRECRLSHWHVRQCGWGAAKPAFELLQTAGGSAANYSFASNIELVNGHGTQLRIANDGVGGSFAHRTCVFRDFMVHGESSWNVGGTGYDASVPLPGGAPWNLIEIEGQVESFAFHDFQTTHSLDGGYVVRIAPLAGQTPAKLRFRNWTNEPAGKNLLLVAGMRDCDLEWSETSGGAIVVNAATGRSFIRGGVNEDLKATIAPAASQAVTLGQAVGDAAIGARTVGFGLPNRYQRRSVALAARTDFVGGSASAWFGTPSAQRGAADVVAQDATPILVQASGFSFIVYTVQAYNQAPNPNTARAEWWGVVTAHRASDPITILAGAAAAGSGRAPNASVLAAGAALRLEITADTTAQGIVFRGVSTASVFDWYLTAEVFAAGAVGPDTVDDVEALLERLAAPAIADAARSPIFGPFADDAAAGAGGVTAGQLFYLTGGGIATKA